jgi:hypothetical protein
MVHLYIQYNLKKLGILNDFEVDVKGLGIGGNADGDITYKGERVVLEVKTMNTFQFMKLVKPDPKHVKQASIYADRLGLEKILFIYYDKSTSDLKLYLVPLNAKYVEDLNTTLKNTITKFKKAKIRKKTPKTERACNNQGCSRASECPYAVRCFKED